MNHAQAYPNPTDKSSTEKTLAEAINEPGVAFYKGQAYPVAQFTFKEIAAIQRRIGSLEAMNFEMLDVQLSVVHLAIQQTQPGITYDEVCALFPINEGAAGFAEAFRFIKRVLELCGLMPSKEENPGPNDLAPEEEPISASTPTSGSSTTGASSAAASRRAKPKT